MKVLTGSMISNGNALLVPNLFESEKILVVLIAMGCAASFRNIVENQHVNTSPELECDDCDAM